MMKSPEGVSDEASLDSQSREERMMRGESLDGIEWVLDEL